ARHGRRSISCRLPRTRIGGRPLSPPWRWFTRGRASANARSTNSKLSQKSRSVRLTAISSSIHAGILCAATPASRKSSPRSRRKKRSSQLISILWAVRRRPAALVAARPLGRAPETPNPAARHHGDRVSGGHVAGQPLEKYSLSSGTQGESWVGAGPRGDGVGALTPHHILSSWNRFRGAGRWYR